MSLAAVTSALEGLHAATRALKYSFRQFFELAVAALGV
jgi:hypothetical protein